MARQAAWLHYVHAGSELLRVSFRTHFPPVVVQSYDGHKEETCNMLVWIEPDFVAAASLYGWVSGWCRRFQVLNYQTQGVGGGVSGKHGLNSSPTASETLSARDCDGMDYQRVRAYTHIIDPYMAVPVNWGSISWACLKSEPLPTC